MPSCAERGAANGLTHPCGGAGAAAGSGRTLCTGDAGQSVSALNATHRLGAKRDAVSREDVAIVLNHGVNFGVCPSAFNEFTAGRETIQSDNSPGLR
jgi:hypothetical protein